MVFLADLSKNGEVRRAVDSNGMIDIGDGPPASSFQKSTADNPLPPRAPRDRARP